MENSIQYIPPRLAGIEALYCANDFAFGNHIHNGHVLWLSSAGGEKYTVHGNSSVLQPGCVSIIEPGVVHSNGPVTPGKRGLCSLYLGEEFFGYLEKLLTGSISGGFLLPTSVIENHICYQHALLLHDAIVHGVDQLCIDECVVALFSGIANMETGCRSNKTKADSSDSRLTRLVDFMRARLHEDLSLEMLAEIAECSSYHVIRLFRQKVGMSPHAYLVQLRLERARELILGGKPLADTAFLCGFSDQSHLTRKFKKRYGLTPGLYGSQTAPLVQ